MFGLQEEHMRLYHQKSDARICELPLYVASQKPMLRPPMRLQRSQKLLFHPYLASNRAESCPRAAHREQPRGAQGEEGVQGVLRVVPQGEVCAVLAGRGQNERQESVHRV